MNFKLQTAATGFALSLALTATVARGADGLDLGSLKPKDASSSSATTGTTTPASTPIGANPMKKPSDATTPAGGIGNAPGGAKANPLNKNMFGLPAGKSDGLKSDSVASDDDLKVKMPSNFKK